MVHAVEKLRKRGLVASYRGYPTHIYLTSKGRSRALELMTTAAHGAEGAEGGIERF
jgi:hypothetical protein